MSGFIESIKAILVEDVIKKYIPDKVDMHEEGSYIAVEPCPKCGHSGCCKINTDNNTLVCFSTDGCIDVKYLSPVKVLMWLQEISYQEAIHKLAEDFGIGLPSNFDEQYQVYLKIKRQNELRTHFATESHKMLTDENRRYWKDRGFTDTLIDKYKIGVSGEDDKIYSILARDFSTEELEESKLFKNNKSYFFFSYEEFVCHYYTLPNWYKDMVIDIQGRRCVDNEIYPKYRNMKREITYLYNTAALKEDAVFLAEGIPDTLSLLQMEFNATGTYGVGIFKDEWLRKFRSKKKVFIIFDTDEAGTKAAYERAKAIGEGAKIITLPPEVKDVNELLIKHDTDGAKEIINDLINKAKTALEIDIDSLPKPFEETDENKLRDVVLNILTLSPIRREHYIDHLAQHFGITKKLIKETIGYYSKSSKDLNSTSKHLDIEPQTKGRLILLPDPTYVRLSQSFALGKVFIAQDLMEERESNGKPYLAKVPYIITSDRKLLDMPRAVSKDSKEIVCWKVEDKELVLRRPLESATSRWSKTGTPYSIDLFSKGEEEKVNSLELYKQIESMFHRYFYTTEEYDYKILSLFTMFTYYYELYDAVPYLYFYGPPESGKSTLCILLKDLSFNGEMVSSITPAALFREAEAKQTTLILDEQEHISSRKANESHGEYMTLIKDAYKRTGTIKRQKISDFAITEEFQVFCPVVIANVYGLEDIIKTRTIQISTKSAPDEAKEQIIRLRQSDESYSKETELIRDKLYCWIMQNHADLRKLPKLEIQHEQIKNRAEEIFQPIFALAAYIDSLDEKGELKLVEHLDRAVPSKLITRSSHKDINELLKEACLEALATQGVTENGQGAWICSYDILDRLVELAEHYQGYMNPSWIGRKIIDNKWISNEARDKKRQEYEGPVRDVKTGLKIQGSSVTERKRATKYYLRYELLV